MSLYAVGGKGLNEYEPEHGDFPDSAPLDYGGSVYDQPANAIPQPDPTEATNAALQVVLNPTSLITDAAASPSIPWPIAVIGICVVGMIWANYLDGGRKK